MRQRLPWILPAFFTGWIAVSLVVLFSAGGRLPVAATNLLSLAFVPFLPFLPVMRSLGLATGVDAYSGPTFLGFVLGILLYDSLLFGIGKLAQRLFRRSQP